MKNTESEKIDWLKNILALAAIGVLTVIYVLILRKGTSSSLLELMLQVIPNLIAALIVVLTIYYIFIRKGISSDNSLKDSLVEKIRELLKEDSFDYQSDIDKEFNLKEKILDAKEILIVGYSCRFFITGLRNEIIEAIKNKVNLKVLAIAPGSDAAKLMMKNRSFKELEFDINEMKEHMQIIMEEVNKSASKKMGDIELRLMNWIPSCSLIFYIPKNNESGILKLKVYAVNHDTRLVNVQTHKLIYEFKEKEMYDYFLNQFHGLWKNEKNEKLH